jgi:hypothetical protein
MQSTNFKTCRIVYGFVNVDELTDSSDSSVILVEPRKHVLDTLTQQRLPSNVVLIAKLLTPVDALGEQTLYTVPNDHKVYVDYNGSNPFKRQKVFTTSLHNIIQQYQIQNLKELVINISIDNIKDVIGSVSCFHHIISRIRFVDGCECNDVDFIVHYFVRDNHQQGYTTFVHKNLNIPHPKVLMFLTTKVPVHLQKTFDLLMAQYDIDVHTPTVELSKTTLHDTLRSIGETMIHSQKYEYVFQFNPKYLLQNKTFQLLHPVQEDTIFINREYDIIYTSAKTMCMLYQIITGEHFGEYIETKRQQRPIGIFKLIHKRYVYDYLTVPFTLRDY